MIELQIQCFAPGEKKGTIDNVVLDNSGWQKRSDIITDQGCTIGIKLMDNFPEIESLKNSTAAPEQHTQPVISVQVVKKLICDWVGENAMEEIDKLIDQHYVSHNTERDVISPYDFVQGYIPATEGKCDECGRKVYHKSSCSHYYRRDTNEIS